MARLLACIILCAIVAAFVWGCSDSGLPKPEQDLHPLRTSPDSLLAQLAWAYENESLGVYMDCFADSFVFYLCEDDCQSHPSMPPSWDLALEDTIHANLFGSGDVNSVQLTLTTSEIETLSFAGGRPAEWNYTEEVDLRVRIGVMTYLAARPSRFTITTDPDETGPHGETLYEIREWHELDLGKRARSPSVEESSWGSIKWLFR